MEKINRIGETSINSYGNKMTIIEYKNNANITIEFENGYKTNGRYDTFKNGLIKSPYDKSIYDIGYLGEGSYKPKINGKLTIQYKYWKNMLRRCYDKTYLSLRPTYEDKTVCKEWLCFQTFAKWFNENYYEIEEQHIELDKDILCKGNLIYSPNNCIFVPQRINSLFVKANAIRGEYPIGVSYYEKYNKFNANCNIVNGVNGKSSKKNLGYYNTPEEAFYNGYKPFKEAYIKQIAEEYKDKIPESLYNAMMNYVVEITD